MILKFEKYDYGRKDKKIFIKKLEKLQIFLDNSSIEIFVNSRAEVFSSRCYCENLQVNLKFNEDFKLKDFVWYGLKKFKIEK